MYWNDFIDRKEISSKWRSNFTLNQSIWKETDLSFLYIDKEIKSERKLDLGFGNKRETE